MLLIFGVLLLGGRANSMLCHVADAHFLHVSEGLGKFFNLQIVT
jgi:hypothetical protein